MNDPRKIGTISVILEVVEAETGNSDTPTYLMVSNAIITSTNLSTAELNRLDDDNPEGIVAYENAVVDAAIAEYDADAAPVDPRIAVMSERLRVNLAPAFPVGSFDQDAVEWLKAIDEAAVLVKS